VIGTTGFSEADLQDLDRRARAKGLLLLVAPNFSLGAVVLERLAAEAARHFPRCEIVEAHHDGKKDAPSGTALATAARVGGAGSGGARAAASAASEASRGLDRSGVRVHSVRLPGLVAHQDVLFGREGEVLTLRHDVTSRTCYVEGVLRAVHWVAASARAGLVRGLEEVLFA
jgi:4-hydroxy-tetrahydrodipicolinate reductase